MLGHRHPDGLERGDFLRSGAGAALDDGSGVAHALARRSGAPGDEGHHRLGHPLGDEARGPLLVAAADFTDEHYSFGQRIVLEHFQHVNEGRADDGVAADADAGSLANTPRGERVDDLVGQRAGARDDAHGARDRNVTGHDADLGLSRGEQPGAVGAH